MELCKTDKGQHQISVSDHPQWMEHLHGCICNKNFNMSTHVYFLSQTFFTKTLRSLSIDNMYTMHGGSVFCQYHYSQVSFRSHGHDDYAMVVLGSYRCSTHCFHCLVMKMGNPSSIRASALYSHST